MKFITKYTRWAIIGFFVGIGFSLALSSFYIIVAMSAGLFSALIRFATQDYWPLEELSWALGCLFFIALVFWFKKRKLFSRATYMSIALVVCISVLILFGSLMSLNNRQIELTDLKTIDGYQVEVLRDYGHSDLERLRSIPIVVRNPDKTYDFTEPEYLITCIAGDLLDWAIARNSSRCRIEVIGNISEPTKFVKESYILLTCGEDFTLLPLTILKGRIVSESFVAPNELAGLQIPRLHELLITNYKAPIYISLLAIK